MGRDADGGDTAVRLNPLMFLGVLEVCGIGHVSCWLLASSLLLLAFGSWLFAFFTSLLRAFVKRRRHDLGLYSLAANFNFHGRTYGCMLGWHVGERNVLLQKWRR